jgi:hypothetical protein
MSSERRRKIEEYMAQLEAAGVPRKNMWAYMAGCPGARDPDIDVGGGIMDAMYNHWLDVWKDLSGHQPAHDRGVDTEREVDTLTHEQQAEHDAPGRDIKPVCQKNSYNHGEHNVPDGDATYVAM